MTAVPPAQHALRAEMVATCRRLAAAGLNQGTSGNLSVRLDPAAGGGYLLTPTSLDYAVMTPEDIVHVAADGTVTGPRRPSSERPFHEAILAARADVTAVIHTHSTHATAVSCLRRPIPPLHYLVALFGGSDIRCAEYATFGTAELSAHIVRALAGRRAVLLANHGLITVGHSLEHALSLVVEAEQLARLYLATLASGVPPVLLDDAEIARVARSFAAYGYRPVP